MKSIFCKKHYIYIGLAVISLGLAVTSHVFAQEPSTVQGENEVEQREGQEKTLSERTQNRIINLARNMINRMDAAIVRLDHIVSRVETRIEKLEDEGVSTENAEMVFGYARQSLTEASTVVGSLDASVASALSSEDPRESFKEIKRQFVSAKYLIRDTQTHIRTIVGVLKDGAGEAEHIHGVDDADAGHGTDGSMVESHEETTEEE